MVPSSDVTINRGLQKELIFLFISSLLVFNLHMVYGIAPLSLNEIAKPLSPDQISEVERDPQYMVGQCSSTLEKTLGHSDKQTPSENDQIALCDNFMLHLKNKCGDFSNLLQYCGLDKGNIVDAYEVHRITQLQCLEDINYDDICIDYFSNSTLRSSLPEARMIPPGPWVSK